MEDKITAKQKEYTSTSNESILGMVSETRSMIRTATMLLPAAKSVDIMEPKLSTPELRQLGLDNLNYEMTQTLDSISAIESNLKELKKKFDKSVLAQGALTHNETVKKEEIERAKRITEWKKREQNTRALSALKGGKHTAIETVRMLEISFEINKIRDSIDKKLPKEEMWARREKTAEAGVNTNFRGDNIFLTKRERIWLDDAYARINALDDEFVAIHNKENPGKPIDKTYRTM